MISLIHHFPNFTSFDRQILKRFPIITLSLALVIACPSVIYGQDEEEKPIFPLETFYAERKKWLRVILKNFHVGLSTGYGNTLFRHNLSGFGVFQPKVYDARIFSINSGAVYTNWVNTIRADTLSTGPDSFFVSSDTTKLGFKGLGFNFPLKATIHYEFLNRYRIGGGYSYEIMVIGPFHPITYKDRISGFQPERPAGFMRKYFGMLGISFYRVNDFLFTGDVNVGGFKPGNNFLSGLITKGIYVNAGVTIEKDFSEYLRAFVRPSFEIKNYTLLVPGSGGSSLVHYVNAAYLNIGLTYSLPELPRCYHKDCEAQINHAHGDREYRSRMHRIFKKQNPQYGENYPKLIKYKGKNRKRLNPY